MSNPQIGVSINPDTFVQGGLIDDVDAILTAVRFAKFDYEGKSDAVLALKVNFTTPDGEPHEQYYSAGDLKRFQPSDDGLRAIPVAGAASLVVSSNASQFLISIVNAGFPKNKLGDDVSVFDGTGVHLRRVAQAERKGLSKPKEGDDRQKTILVVEKILFQPGTKPTFTIGSGTTVAKGAPAAGKSVGAPAAAASAPAAPAGGDIDEKTAGYIIQVLSENGGSFNKTILPNALFKLLAAAKDPDQSKVLNTAFKPEWIGSADRPWKLNADGFISL
jgi:hypothetical protein